MTTFKVPTRDQVSAESRQIFDVLQKRMGKVPNLYAVTNVPVDFPLAEPIRH